jgi:peptide/nickel transport system ATP-binding protein
MVAEASEHVLDVSDYSLDYRTATGPFHVLKEIELSVKRGEILGLVGESGSGKTSLAWSIMRYLPRNAEEIGGSILLSGEELLRKSPREMENIRGSRISMVFQDPGTSLNPTLSLGQQLSEVLVAHRGLGPQQALRESISLLADVGIKTPAEMMKRMPHEASGGEKQRIIIAAAFACEPDFIIFDEPTTALDVITARQIIDLLTQLQARTGVGALYISHDLALVSQAAHRIAVIHRGEIVEQGTTDRIFSMPERDYTRTLVSASPDPRQRLVEDRDEDAKGNLLEAKDITVRYGRPAFLSGLVGQAHSLVIGNRSVSLAVKNGEILGVVGESGSGKSTLAKALVGLNAFEGEIVFDGRSIRGIGQMDRNYRRNVQIIFQHPDASLSPRQKVSEILSRPLKLYGRSETGVPRREIIERLLHQVRLPPEYADRYPHQLSGGEKQRVAIARAFASHPRLVICDEITSALDVSVQASVVELLVELQRQFGTAYLFITHDLNLLRQIAHRIAVMYRGDLIEITGACEITSGERADYTRRLINAVPLPPRHAAISFPTKE